MFTAKHKAALSASCQGETVTAELLLFSGMFATLHSRTDILKQSILKKSSSKAYMWTSLRANAGSTWGWTRVCVGRTNLPLDQILNKEPCAESTIITSISQFEFGFISLARAYNSSYTSQHDCACIARRIEFMFGTACARPGEAKPWPRTYFVWAFDKALTNHPSLQTQLGKQIRK